MYHNLGINTKAISDITKYNIIVRNFCQTTFKNILFLNFNFSYHFSGKIRWYFFWGYI